MRRGGDDRIIRASRAIEHPGRNLKPPSSHRSRSACSGKQHHPTWRPPGGRRPTDQTMDATDTRARENRSRGCYQAGLYNGRLARTFQSTRTRRCREQYMPLVALCQRHFLADSIIYMCVFHFRQAHPAGDGPGPFQWPGGQYNPGANVTLKVTSRFPGVYFRAPKRSPVSGPTCTSDLWSQAGGDYRSRPRSQSQ